MNALNDDFERFKARVQASMPRPSAEERQKGISRALASFDRYQQELSQETPHAEPTILQNGLRRLWRGITLPVRSLALPMPRRRLALAVASIALLVAIGPSLNNLWKKGNGWLSAAETTFYRCITGAESREVRRILKDVEDAIDFNGFALPRVTSFDPDDEILYALADRIHDASKEPGVMDDLRYCVSVLTKFLDDYGIRDSLAPKDRIEEFTFEDLNRADNREAAVIVMAILRDILEASSTDDSNHEE